MADFTDHITDKHKEFVEAQPMFFTATAAEGARINLSPKGMDCFRVLSPNLCGYLDVTGSGNETSAHLKHDGRITVMFNSFTRNALIYRIYGKGRVVRKGTDEYADLVCHFEELPGARQIILVDVESTQSSCGYAVPEMELKSERQTLKKWAQGKGDDGILDYQQKNNVVSIDGLESGLNK
jgi:predicted pyridoxine 5'-phosphate oxidase superfamily flavin-nucleotide-binding protein